MADYEFDTALYPSVRAAIGMEVDDHVVPDTTLDLPVYKGEAERFIMRNLTEAQYADAEYADEADYAATLYLASLITPTLRVVVSERIAGGNLTYANVNLDTKANELRDRALARIADVQTAIPVPSANSVNPNFFTVAKRRVTW